MTNEFSLFPSKGCTPKRKSRAEEFFGTFFPNFLINLTCLVRLYDVANFIENIYVFATGVVYMANFVVCFLSITYDDTMLFNFIK